jgi:hypothetical protein
MTLTVRSGWFGRRRAALEKKRRDAAGEGLLPFDRGALCVYWVSLALSPSWLFIDMAKCLETDGKSGEGREKTLEKLANWTAGYVALWVIALGVIFALSPTDNVLAKVFAGIAFIRLAEIGSTILGFILNRQEPLLARSLVTVAFQALQIALIFAIADHAFARTGFATEEGINKASHVATAPLDFLYISMTTMITVGNHYNPETGIARWLEASTAAAGIVLLGVVVARAIGLAAEDKGSGLDDGKRSSQPKCSSSDECEQK